MTSLERVGSCLENIQSGFGGDAGAQPGPASGPRPKGQDCISSSSLILNVAPSKLRLAASLSIKVLPHPCASQTLSGTPFL